MNDLTKATLMVIAGVFFFGLGLANWIDYSVPSAPTRSWRYDNKTDDRVYTEPEEEFERRLKIYNDKVNAAGANATMPYPYAVAATLVGAAVFLIGLGMHFADEQRVFEST